MNKPRIFLGSSGKQAKLLQAITRGLEDVADVEPWTTTFNPGRSTLDRLVELSQEVDFAAFVFAQDDWTTTDASQSGQASPRDNVVFEAGLFGGALGIRRTFILHAHGSKLPSDLLGLTSVRYDPATSSAEVRAINQKLRKAIETEGRRGTGRGAVVAALAHHAQRRGTVGGGPSARLAGPRRWLERDGPGLAGGRHSVGPLLE
jgi:predicted nucleotide-binding protein